MLKKCAPKQYTTMRSIWANPPQLCDPSLSSVGFNYKRTRISLPRPVLISESVHNVGIEMQIAPVSTSLFHGSGWVESIDAYWMNH